MENPIEILPLPLQTREIRRFINVSYGIYGRDPHWVAPLIMDLEKVFTPKNPLFEHAEMALWVARLGGRDVGRIAGILDHSHNKTQNDSAAFFGYFESIDDPAVSHALFEALYAWARQKGVRRVLGPMNPTMNDECGLLIKGFDSAPVFMMTYNPEYYIKLLEREGMAKAKDLIAYIMDTAHAPKDRLTRVADKIRQRHPELSFRPIRKKTLESDLGKVKEIYNAAWEANWGFVPMTDAEIDFMAERLKPILVEGLLWLAETPKEPVGFMLCMPDFNSVIQPLKGHLLTPKLIPALPYLLGWKSPKLARVLTLGVRDGYRNRGIEAVMLHEGLMTFIKMGYTRAEASWILEDNTQMTRLLEPYGAQPYKTYRLYERAV